MTDTQLAPGTVVVLLPDHDQIALGPDLVLPTQEMLVVGVLVDKPVGAAGMLETDDNGDLVECRYWVKTSFETRAVKTRGFRVAPPVPTDPDGLRDVLTAAGGQDARNNVLARLEFQIGQEPAWNLFNPLDSEIRHGEEITDARTQLRTAVKEATAALARVRRAHDDLAGDTVFDPEFAESATADLARGYLKDATRALDTYRAINVDGVLTPDER